MNCKRVGVIGSLAIGVTLVGCGLEGLVGGMAQNFEYAKKIEVHPEYNGLGNESVAVIVQTDMATMYEYPNVDLLMASGVAGRLQMHVEGVRVLDPRLVNSWQFRTPQWSALAFGEMAERLKVNRIVYIDVYEYRLNPPGNRYLWDGVCAANVSIIERDSYDPDMFVDTFRKQLGAYRMLFGGTPDSIYLVTIRLADEDDGESFENSFNQVILPGRLDQRVIVWANTMGHELFHYWNGNHVLVGKDKSAVEWFGEGFTEYYASLTLFRTGLISQDLWYRKLETYLARHIITTRLWPVETLSLVDAGKEKHKNWLRIYGSGATMALILDIEIRSVTGGTRGLDDVMRRLADRFGEPGSRFEVSDILSAVNGVSGKDFAAFFDAHITGSDGQLNIAKTLRKAGIRTEQFSDEFYLSPVSF